MRFAYADPPYVGQAKKHYAHDERCAEVDHRQLIDFLCDTSPDGWALSLSAPSLRQVIAMCPADARTLAWVKPFASFKAGVTLAYAWEPVILWRGRRRPRAAPTVRDWIAESITLRKGLAGAKPQRFCWWLFNAAGLTDDDDLFDMYPGSGAVSHAWKLWRDGHGRDETGGAKRAK